MVNERDEQYENHDESEYHFSDDQSAYELDSDTEADSQSTSSPASVSAKDNVVLGLKRYRRMIIGVVVFIALMVVAYKLVVPTTTPVSPDFADTVTKAPTKVPVKPITQQPTTATAQQQSTPPMSMPMSGTMADQPSNPMAATSVPTVSSQPMPQPTVQASVPAQEPPAMSAPASNNIVTMVPGASPDKSVNIDQQAAQMASMMGAEYAQKLADAQAQNTAMQAKINELNTRLANMEATLNQLTQAILNKQASSANASRSLPAPTESQVTPMSAGKMGEPKMAYTVQAIIPGRAWLKSDGGDTVTVAEGDILKGYGRIAKIDPYDGVVDIDTGSKTVTLSYGSSGE